MDFGSDFVNINSISPDDELFHGSYQQDESWENTSKAIENGKLNPIGFPANEDGSLADISAMDLDFEASFRLIQAAIEAPNRALIDPPVNIDPSLPATPPGAGIDLDCFQENAFVSLTPSNAVQTPNQGAEPVSNKSGGLQSANWDETQTSENKKAYQPATPQLHAMNPLMDESSNYMLMGNPDPKFVENTDGLQFYVVPDDVANALKQMGAATDSVTVLESENAIQSSSAVFLDTENLMETSATTSDSGSDNTEPCTTSQNEETMMSGKMHSTSKPPKRRGKKEKMHQNPNLDDPRVKRARDQWEKREKKKKYDEERENKISTLTKELKDLQTEIEKREVWKHQLEKVTAENIELKTKLKTAEKLNEELQAEQSNQITNPVQTMKMLDCFQNVVSRLPDKCEIVITQRLAEMRAPVLTEDCMQRIRKNQGQEEAPSEDTMKLTAVFSVPGDTDPHNQIVNEELPIAPDLRDALQTTSNLLPSLENIGEFSHSTVPVSIQQTEPVASEIEIGDNEQMTLNEETYSASTVASHSQSHSSQQISTKPKRREKIVKFYERQDSNDPRVPRAINAKLYRERKKQAEEQLKEKNAEFKAKCKELSEEIEKCNQTIATQDETISKLKNENEQLATENKDLKEQSKKVPTPVQTVQMINYFRDTVSKLPQGCEIIIPPHLAEMRVPHLSEDEIEVTRQNMETQPVTSELSLKLTAFYDLYKGSGKD
ncbi:hypothetical protein Ocin01_16368 [Orchesella cincta]|uniref:BZIP domain-containing protein n=1 Tax=Orchesella cincta TaxID=48709 RepID=A0A1D2MBH0_ORCCI|nr:hypothetical protein Ocin01_16368 [Orchesella cincta]